MALIAVLFCLALQRFVDVSGGDHASWFEYYLRRLSPWIVKVDERLAVVLVIAPVLLLFLLSHLLFKSYLFGLFDLVSAVIVLFFCIDARDLRNKLKEYFSSLEKSDVHAAAVAAEGFIADDAMGNMAELRRAVTKAILVKSFENIFAGLFWFMIFGVYGVVTYTLINLLRQHSLKVDPNYIELIKISAKIQSALEWVPSRLVGFSYALVGNFNKGFGYSIRYLWTGLTEVKQFAVDSGLAALDVDGAEVNQHENYEALEIVSRVLIIWLVMLTLVLIGSWL